MLNPKVLIKLLNSRSSVDWQGLQNGLLRGCLGQERISGWETAESISPTAPTG